MLEHYRFDSVSYSGLNVNVWFFIQCMTDFYPKSMIVLPKCLGVVEGAKRISGLFPYYELGFKTTLPLNGNLQWQSTTSQTC